VVVIVVGERYVVVVVAMCVPLFGGTCLPFCLLPQAGFSVLDARKRGEMNAK
jgi:hypothetical protein